MRLFQHRRVVRELVFMLSLFLQRGVECKLSSGLAGRSRDRTQRTCLSHIILAEPVLTFLELRWMCLNGRTAPQSGGPANMATFIVRSSKTSDFPTVLHLTPFPETSVMEAILH
jgi:hypothetical protein